MEGTRTRGDRPPEPTSGRQRGAEAPAPPRGAAPLAAIGWEETLTTTHANHHTL